MWRHKKYGKTVFIGSYNSLTLRDGARERVFHLSGTNTKKQTFVVSFESWQKAKKEGWVRT